MFVIDLDEGMSLIFIFQQQLYWHNNSFPTLKTKYFVRNSIWEEIFILAHNSRCFSPSYYRKHGNRMRFVLCSRKFLCIPEKQEAEMGHKAHPSYEFQKSSSQIQFAQSSHQNLGTKSSNTLFYRNILHQNQTRYLCHIPSTHDTGVKSL